MVNFLTDIILWYLKKPLAMNMNYGPLFADIFYYSYDAAIIQNLL